jgi:hypothetical protein
MRLLRAAVVLAAIAAGLAPLPADRVERLYSQRFYLDLQAVVTRASSATAVAWLDVAVALLLALATLSVARRRRRAGWRAAGGYLARLALVGGAVIYLWFLAAWGLNYRRVPLEQRLAYDPSRISRDGALALARMSVAEVNALAVASSRTEGDLDALARSLAEVERMLGAPRAARTAAPKRSLLAWYFRTAAIDGMTDPFFLEIIVNPDLLPFERPFTLAHEWAHLAGYADEAEANFVAWLACVRGPDEARYSGWLTAYEQLAGVLPPEDRRALRASLGPAVAADLGAVRARLARSSPRVSTAARNVYDGYLRANRVDEGIASYGAVVRLMLGSTLEPGWIPVRRQTP